MRKTFNYSLLGLGMFLFFACNSTEKQSEIPVVDVTKTYPEKKIILQDIADVEYIPLETRDDVLLEQWVGLGSVTQDTIVVYNREQGDIFIFDGKGKFLRKFNHKGQSGMEYTYIRDLYYFPKDKELFVVNNWGNSNILVYDTNGNYKRMVPMPEGYAWNKMVDYNDSLLFCYDNFEALIISEENPPNKEPFIFISKEDGHIVSNLGLTLPKRLATTRILHKDAQSLSYSYYPFSAITPFEDSFVIDEISLDTIYSYANETLTPLLARIPAVQMMPEDKKIWLKLQNISPKYIFLQSAVWSDEKDRKFETVDLLVDRNTNEIYTVKLKSDIENMFFNHKLLSIDFLTEALEEGKLSGKLKEIAEKLTSDDNPVLVKVKFKE